MSVNDDVSERSSRWEGYSNYQAVSQQIAQKVSDAVEAYALLQSSARERADLAPREYAEARSRILDAAMSLKVEIEREAEDNGESVYADIVDRWTEGGTDLEDGYIDQFHTVSFRDDGVPGWVFTFVEDIRRGAWELGYLQAGQTVTDNDLEPAEEQAKQMFEK